MIIFRTLTLAAIVLAFSFCDRVDDPYEHIDEDIDVNEGEGANIDTVYNDTNAALSRRIMVEDFTGMKCNNCPRASDEGKKMQADFGNDIVFVAIHNSGNFSKPDDEFPLDLETETGENLRVRNQMGEFPMGTLNRTDYDNSGTVRTRDINWYNIASQMINDQDYIEARFKLKVEAVYNYDTRVLRLRPHIECLRAVDDEVRIHAYVLEDGIIGPQLDSRESPALIPDYEFKDVLRIGFPNNESGRTIFDNPAPGDEFQVTDEAEDELRVNIDESWNEDKLSIVVYLTNSSTEEVIHSDRFYLKQ